MGIIIHEGFRDLFFPISLVFFFGFPTLVARLAVDRNGARDCYQGVSGNLPMHHVLSPPLAVRHPYCVMNLTIFKCRVRVGDCLSHLHQA